MKYFLMMLLFTSSMSFAKEAKSPNSAMNKEEIKDLMVNPDGIKNIEDLVINPDNIKTHR